MKEEIYNTFSSDMYEIWNIAFGEDVKPDFETYKIMYKKLEEYWSNLTQSDYDLWEEGYRRICESLGNSYFTFDSDGPEQDSVIYDLIDLIFNHTESITYKQVKEGMRIKQLEQDF